MGQPSFQNGTTYMPMSMMMPSPQYQAGPGASTNTYNMPQGFNTNHTGQNILGAMNRNLHDANGMGLNFCPHCGEQWPCAVHCMRS